MSAWLSRALAAAGLALGLGLPAQAAAPLISTATSSDVFFSASHFYSHGANGYYWVAFGNGAQIVLFSSPNGVTWTSQGAVFTFAFGAPTRDRNYWAVRYLGNTIVAMGFNVADNTRYYRSGTLNADGTVTWAAVEAPVGAATATNAPLNALIANGKPVMWRADINGNGALWRGSALTAPVWAPLPGVVPAYGLTSGFSAGALFPTGGGNPDDLVVLRSFTQAGFVAGNHHLLSLRWNAALGAYDGSWYNVSTLGGVLIESPVTQVEANDDVTAQRVFAAARDTSGNIHAAYVNNTGRVVHYAKAVGFNNSWSRLSTDVTGANTTKLSLGAVAGNNLFLFYEKSAVQGDIYMRRFDGTAWGAEVLLFAGAGTNLHRSLAPIEMAVGCTMGLAFAEQSAVPINVRFTVASTDCAPLQTAEGTGTVTVTAPGSFEMTFNTAAGGGVQTFYDLAEDPTRANDLAGAIDPRGLQNFGISVGVDYYNATLNTTPKLDLLEATPTRVKVRQEAFYETNTGLILAGVKGVGDHTIYPSGRLALKWTRPITVPFAYTTEYFELVAHRAAAPLNAWTPQSQTDATNPNLGTEAFVLAQSEVPGARTDFLQVLYKDWTVANLYSATADATSWDTGAMAIASERLNLFWQELTGAPLAAGAGDTWNLLTTFKPTTFTGFADPGVIMRASDYRTPAALSVALGSGWNENPADADFFNESEAAYTLDLNPATGLTFDINGAATNRFHPFFKIRQWRSLAPPGPVTLEAVSLVRGVDFQSDVKPLSRAHFADRVLFHTTLQSFADVTTPDIGSGTGATNNSIGYGAARYGFGAGFNSTADHITVPAVVGGLQNIELDRGRIEFWFLPGYPHTDNQEHYLFDIDGGAGVGRIRMKKESNVSAPPGPNRLSVDVTDSAGVVHNGWIPAANYRWDAGEWVHLAMEWDRTAGADNVRAYLNGVRLTPNAASNGAFAMGAESAALALTIGNSPSGAFNAAGTFDEFTVYDAPTTPTPIAHGGLTSDTREYLADTSRNFLLDLTGVDTDRRGRYLLLGADARFRGLNVGLQTAGAGVLPGALVWEYWNGTDWASLEAVAGFADTTGSFTGDGNVYWNADPGGWLPYSVNGGPDLYYVRASLPMGTSYSITPREGAIKTDILLFQYCGDITLDNRTFNFVAPVPTAVELMSFQATGRDSAADLSWETGTELENLGFHVYRGLSAQGPFERITSAVIPGLGSSPEGARYGYRDSGLQNGVTYYYELEDIETTGKTKRHGPVSATPQPGVSPGPGGSSGDGGSSGGGSGGGGGSDGGASGGGSSSPGSGTPTPSTRITYGDPSNVSFRVLSRSSTDAVLELRTGGFLATPLEDGSVRLEIPSFAHTALPGQPDLPVFRTWIEAVAGRKVTLESIRPGEITAWTTLRPEAASAPEVEVSHDGTVRAVRRQARSLFRHGQGLLPAEPASLLQTAFQGETKKAFLEMAPLRYDSATGQLLLARVLTVRVSFRGREPDEVGFGGPLGRRLKSLAAPHRTNGLLARFGVEAPGLYAVSFADVFGAGRRSVPANTLTLSRQGQSVAFHVEPRASVFGPGSTLFFVSEGSALTPWAKEAVYELARAAGSLTMSVADASPAGTSVLEYSRHDLLEQNKLYQAALLDAPSLWLWDYIVSPAAKSYPFQVSSLSSSGTPARLTVYLQGGSDFEANPDHHVRIRLNGTEVAETSWDGKLPRTVQAEVPSSVLLEGQNQLEIQNVGDTQASSSLVILDRFTLDYPRQTLAESGRLEGTFLASGATEVSGLGAGAALLDVTEARPRWLTGAQTTPSGLRFRTEAGRRYLALSVSSVLHPTVKLPTSNPLRDANNQADYILIAPREFLEPLPPPLVDSPGQRLLDFRQAQGLSVRGVAVEDVYDQFGYGEVSPQAIKDFLAFAYHRWKQPSPRYVLLLGDTTYDPKNFLQLQNVPPDRIPSLTLKTSFLWTVSDPSLAAVNGDDLLPDLAIGRLSASSVQEAQLLVQKLITFENAALSLDGPDVLVADNPDVAGDFEKDADEIATTLLAGHPVEKIYIGQLGAATRPTILDAFNRGASLMSYLGHGSPLTWASENVLNVMDVNDLNFQPQAQQPFLLTMNCLNGYFNTPTLNSLAEQLVKADGKGAIATFAPSGLSVNDAAHVYHKAFLQEILSANHPRIGDALLAAQVQYANSGAFPELLSIYHLLGDPALRVSE